MRLLSATFWEKLFPLRLCGSRVLPSSVRVLMTHIRPLWLLSCLCVWGSVLLWYELRRCAECLTALKCRARAAGETAAGDLSP